MRTIINKLIKGHSTSGERRFMEILKELHIPFHYKVKIQGREVDFIIGSNAIEIDGHTQDVKKNKMLLSENYIPVHLNNNEISQPYVKEWLKELK